MIDLDKIEAAASADRELDTVTILRPAVVREMVSMIRERDAVLKQALYLIESWDRGCDIDDYYMDTAAAIAAIKGVLES